MRSWRTSYLVLSCGYQRCSRQRVLVHRDPSWTFRFSLVPSLRGKLTVHGVSRTQLPCWHVLTHDCIDFQWRFVVKCSHAGPRTDPCKPDISVVSANTLTVRWGLSQTFITPCAWLTHRYPATTGSSRWPTFCERYHRHGNRPRALLAHRRQLSANSIGGSRRISVPFARIFTGSHPNLSAARLLCMPTVTEITSRETGRVCPIGTITHGRVI